MPRGKVTSEMLKFVADTGDADVKEQEKITTAKFTLIEPEPEEDKGEDELIQSVHNEFAETLESNRPNFKFTLLLVALFVAVNIGLITLLDDNKKPVQPSVESDNVPVVTIDKQGNIVAPEKTAAPTIKQETVEKPQLSPAAPTGVTLQRPVPAAPVAAAATSAAKEKPAGKHQPAADLLSIIGKY